jgi:hypothetical protein
MNWFKKSKINIFDCPATSPDLNPIGNLRNISDKKLTNYHPTIVNDLQQMILHYDQKYPFNHVKT